MGKRQQVGGRKCPANDRPAAICTTLPPDSPVNGDVKESPAGDWKTLAQADGEGLRSYTHSARYRARCGVSAVVFAIFVLLELIVRGIRLLLLELPRWGAWRMHRWLDSRRVVPSPSAVAEQDIAERLAAPGRAPKPPVVNTQDGTERLQRFIPEGEVQLIFNTSGVSTPPFALRAAHTVPLWNRHIETIFANLRPFAPHRYVRERFKSWDGCTLCLDWAFANSPAPGTQRWSAKGVVLTIPGLASSSATTYVECFVRHVTEAGYHCAVLNARGMGNTPLDAPRVVDGYNTSDIRQAIVQLDPARLERRFGIAAGTPLFLVGHSLGGSMMCKLLGELGRERRMGRSSPEADRVRGAVAVCVPWDFHHTHHHMMRLVSRLVYQQHLTDGLVEYLSNHIDRVRTIPHFDIDELLSRGLRKVQDYDEHIASPHLGFASKEDYYTASQSLPYLPDVAVPLLCLATRNDPIIGTPLKDAQWEAVVRRNPNVSYVCLPCGGHLAFLQGYRAELAFRGNPMETACTQYFDGLLKTFSTTTIPHTLTLTQRDGIA